MLPKTEVRYLAVQFSNDELQEIGLKLAQAHEDITRLEEQKKEEGDRFKGLIAEKHTAAAKFSRDRLNGYHIEPIECTVDYDFATGTKTITRPDTSEAVATLPLDAAERQMEIREVAAVTG